MAGTLTINSNGAGSILSGHSWIEFTPDGGSGTSYGTWGNNPDGAGNGLLENIELKFNMVGEATRKAHLDDAQEKKLMDTVEAYRKKGDDGWQKLNPCSGFAAEAWEHATGESLSHRSGIISNPSKLKASIVAANAGDLRRAKSPDAKPAPARGNSSRRRWNSSVQPCSGGRK